MIQQALLAGSPTPWGVKSWWKLNEAAGASRVDSGPNGYTLADHNTVGQGTGLLGNCATYNGTNQWNEASSGSILNITGTITYVAFVKILGTTLGNFAVLSKDDSLAAETSNYVLIASSADYANEIVWQIETDAGTINAKAGCAPIGQWFALIADYDPVAQTLSVQVNNEPPVITTGVTGTPRVNNSLTFVIGCVVAGANFSHIAGGPFGRFDRLLPPTERRHILRIVPNYNPGTLHGCSWAADVPAALSANVNSLSFNGSSDYVSMLTFCLSPGILAGAVGIGGISLWFKAVSFAANMYLVGQAEAFSYIGIINSTTIRVQTSASDFKDFTVPTMSMATWYNLIFYRDSANDGRVYLNGTQSSSGAQKQFSYAAWNQLGRLWDGSAGFFFNGKLADVQFFRFGGLSAGDIAALAAGTPTTAIPMHRWKLNEGTGTAANDLQSGPGGRDFPF